MKRAALFGHIQRNNLRSLALLALFLCLIEASQIAIRLVPAAMSVSFMTRLNPATQFDNTVVSIRPSRNPDAGRWETVVSKRQIDDGFGAVWRKYVSGSTFFERDWYLILIIGMVYISLACWRSVVLMRYETGARPVEKKDAPQLYNLVENLAISIGLPCPRIELIESDKLNAYAAGFFPKASTIAVTRGLIRNLTRDELEAVLAHELIHIRDRDVRLMVVARACVDLVFPISRVLTGFASRHPVISTLLCLQLVYVLGLAFALILAIIIGTIGLLAIGARFAISQTREFTADAGAIELTKNPGALVAALRKVALADDLPLTGYASRAMMFSSTTESFFGVLIGSHPTIEARINAIVLHGGVTSRELQPSLPRCDPAVQQSTPAFGRSRVVHGLRGKGSRIAAALVTTTVTDRGAAATAFGRRTLPANTIDPGRRPIAEPAARAQNVETQTERPGTSDWIVGRKADRVAGRAARLVELCVVTFACFSLGMIFVAFGLIIWVRAPMVALTLVGLAIWLVTGRAKRDIDWLLERISSEGDR